MKFHPATEIFPLTVGYEFDALTKDIEENGQKVPIILHQDGSVLDGRNRLRACERLGVKPRFVTREKTGDEVSFVVTLNLWRRHLNESQRALIAAKLTDLATANPEKPPENKEVERGVPIGTPPLSKKEAAAALNVSPRSVTRARNVLRGSQSDVVTAVAAGEKSIAKAEKEAPVPNKKKKPTPQHAAQKKMAAQWRKLEKGLELFASLPSAKELVTAIPASRREMFERRLPVVRGWLDDLNAEWDEYHGKNT